MISMLCRITAADIVVYALIIHISSVDVVGLTATSPIVETFDDVRIRHLVPRPRTERSPVPERFYTAPYNVNRHTYHYVINNEALCRQPDVFLLMLIRSAPSHATRRQAIRETWGAQSPFPGHTIVRAFVFGQTTNSFDQHQIELESRQYGDVIQESFHDSYLNLTIKDVTALKWTVRHCLHAHYVMIGSDEILVDIYKVIPYLIRRERDQSPASESRTFVLCHLYPCCTRVYRTHPKYNVSKIVYDSTAYPAFCSGTAYIAKPKLIQELFYMSWDSPSFMPDDAWIGVLAEKLGSEFHDTYESFSGIRNRPTVLKQLLQDDHYADSVVMVAVLDYDFPGREAEMIRSLWQTILRHHAGRTPSDMLRQALVDPAPARYLYATPMRPEHRLDTSNYVLPISALIVTIFIAWKVVKFRFRRIVARTINRVIGNVTVDHEL